LPANVALHRNAVDKVRLTQVKKPVNCILISNSPAGGTAREAGGGELAVPQNIFDARLCKQNWNFTCEQSLIQNPWEMEEDEEC